MINKSNKGIGRFEVMTMIVILLAILAYLMYLLLGGTERQKFDTMKDNAITFSKTATTNMSSFHNLETVYLNEVIEEGMLKRIKSPFSAGYCDETESKVEVVDGTPLVTLKCGEYLIENAKFNSKDDVDIYIVSKWSEKKTGKKDEERVLYNCLDDEKEVFSEYMEELQMISRINKDNQTDFYSANDVTSICKPVSKTFYRTKELVKE